MVSLMTTAAKKGENRYKTKQQQQQQPTKWPAKRAQFFLSTDRVTLCREQLRRPVFAVRFFAKQIELNEPKNIQRKWPPISLSTGVCIQINR